MKIEEKINKIETGKSNKKGEIQKLKKNAKNINKKIQQKKTR